LNSFIKEQETLLEIKELVISHNSLIFMLGIKRLNAAKKNILSNAADCEKRRELYKDKQAEGRN